MTLNEYWKNFVACWPAPIEGDIPVSLVPLVAAGHKIGLPPEQLLQFQIHFLKIKDVSSRLSARTLKAETVEEISFAYDSGCVYSKEVITKLFSENEIIESYKQHFFPKA
jgi:hypothetical protein